MTREDMHKVLDAAIDANERHCGITVRVEFDVSATDRSEMDVSVSIWGAGDKLADHDIFHDTAKALAMIEKYGGTA